MSSRPVPAELLPWALSALGECNHGQEPDLSMIAGDASNRRYFRLLLGGRNYVLAEAPPATEKNEAFLAVRDMLSGAGVKVPALYAADIERGYLLLEDLGDKILLPELSAASVDRHYHVACSALRQMAALGCGQLALPPYDSELLGEELNRFPDWFVESLLAYSLDTGERALLDRLFTRLIDTALEQPRVVVHRDFHSRNLMLQPDGQLAVIDFQDAVVGPVSYDLVSLLRDCYIQWPADRVRTWALAHRDAMCEQGLLAEVDDALFLRWFDWMGLQRHIKVLGTFARLYLRDGKAAYLEDLPLVIAYVLEILEKYRSDEPTFAECLDWFEHRLSPLIARRGWGDKL